MSLKAGTRVGPYEVRAVIGAGGMGEVYRALDTKLGRDVALKILPDTFLHDPERLARFEREAHVLASLNHPNIATVHGLEQTADGHAIVMELVEGPTLADRIAAGAVPVDEALAIARQVAAALEAAHERGVIHRDLKPANIKLKDDGSVKVLDFGLAKVLEPPTTPGDGTHSPTMTSPATQQGILLGTAAYMAPEQARGRPADKRADIWAFGVVLYELLTGRRAFEGEDASTILAGVIRAEPDWSTLPDAVPPTVQVYLRRCLEKDPRRRIRDIGDLGLALAGAFDAATANTPPAVARRSWLLAGVGLVGLAIGVGLGALFFAGVGSDGAPSAQAVVRFSMRLLPGHAFFSNVISPLQITPDGQHVVFVAGPEGPVGSTGLFLRSFDRDQSVALSGEANIGSIFMSPDGNWVGMNRNIPGAGALRKVRLTGGLASSVSGEPLVAYAGTAWSDAGTIAFNLDGGRGGLLHVQETGGAAQPLTTAPAGELHVQPHFLPGGRQLLFVRRRPGEPDRIVVFEMQSRESRDLLEGASPLYVRSGHLLFTRDAVVWAVAFDALSATTRGEPLPVLEDVDMIASTSASAGWARLAVSGNGTLVYIPRRSALGSRLMWVTREGTASPLPLAPDDYWLPRLAPDGRRLAVGIGPDLWVIDLDRGGRTRLTFGQTTRQFPFTWTPDGNSIAFAGPESNRIYRVSSRGGTPEPLLDGPHAQWPTSWSSDSQTLAFYVNNPQTARDLWTMSAGGASLPTLFLGTPFQERGARFGPAGGWLAYVSDESGADEVYVRPHPGPGPQVPISVAGGTEPVWSRDGSELFYRLGAEMMAVDVQTTGGLTAAPPRVLFSNDRLALELGGVGGNASYDVHPDGERFVMLDAVPLPSDVQVVVNWFEELERLVPTR